MAQFFSYPDNDCTPYLSWYRDDFSSVFVAANPFLKVPGFSSNNGDDWIPEEVYKVAKQQGITYGISWHQISELCDFPSLAHVNRALRGTGSKRISPELASPADTKKMLQICADNNIFITDEGRFSSLAELSVAYFLKQLGHDEVIVADHFGTFPRKMKTEAILSPDAFLPAETYAKDRTVYLTSYIDYHYFLVCQTEESKLAANPMDFFEGFFADENTNDLWGVGDLSNKKI
jgi:hypothetical protein